MAESSSGGDGVGWVSATPFRAHVAHLMAVGDISVEVVAAMAGISGRAARHLRWGRRGRPVRRISAETGRRLLRVTSWQARTVRRRLVPARGAGCQLRELLAAGLDLATVAHWSGAPESALVALAAGRQVTCSLLVAAQVAAVHSALDVGDEIGYPLAS